MADYGLKIARPGYDVGTATLQQIAFSSQYPIFKIGFSGSLTLVVAANGGSGWKTSSVSFTHNLGYIPAFRAYGLMHDYSLPNTNLNNRILDVKIYPASTSIGELDIRARMTTTQLIIYGDNEENNQYTYIINYIIYVDPGT